MPESPEMLISAEKILPLVQNKKIINAFPFKNGRYRNQNPKGFEKFLSFIKDYECCVLNIETRGKFMYWTLSEGWYIFITFGMSGQLSEKQGEHPCFGFSFGTVEDYFTIYFNDPRHFGTIMFIDQKNELDKKLKKFGWDPFKHKMDEKWISWIQRKLKNCSKPIAQVLMDQSIFNGSGNYLRSETLYQSKISPWRACNSLSEKEIILLCQSLHDIMHESYNHQGATFLTHKNPDGIEGKQASFFKCYRKQQDSFGNPIITETTPEGRTIHWCPAVQK